MHTLQLAVDAERVAPATVIIHKVKFRRVQ